MSVRLFVGNLPYDVTEAELKTLFAASGAAPSVRIPIDRETGKPRGFAFVEFAERTRADEAIRTLNGQLFKGRPLSVNEARAREDGPAARPRPAPRPGDWPSEPGAAEAPARAGQPRRTFGPDAPPRGKRKPEIRSSKGEKAPKGPLRERTGGQFFAGDVDDAHEEDPEADDFSLWAKEKPDEPGEE